MRYLYLLCMCSIIFAQNTIATFSFKKVYSYVIPQKMHQAVIYEEYDCKNITVLTVANKMGNVTVKTDANQDNVFLKAIKKSGHPDMLPDLTFLQSIAGNHMHIKANYDEKEIDGIIDFELIVPKKLALNVTIIKGDATLTQPYAPCIVSTQKGSIDVYESHGVIDATTHVKGAITFRKPHARVTAQTKKGDICIYDALDSIVAHADCGMVELFAREIPSTSSIKLTTVSGIIALHLPPDVNADLHASTQNGVITSDHFIKLKPQTTQLNKNAWKRFQKEIDGTLGTGEAQIQLSSVRSNIKLVEIKA